MIAMGLAQLKRRTIMKKFSSLAALTVAASSFAQQPFIAEICVNPDGTDVSQEYIEIQGPAGLSLSGYWYINIEGDGTAAGTIDQRVDLSAYTIGSNGLLLIRDSALALFPAPESGTNVVVTTFGTGIENGSSTHLLGFGTPPVSGTDFDLNQDSVLDNLPWVGFTVVDGVSTREEEVAIPGAINLAYAANFGQLDFPNYGDIYGVPGWTPDHIYRVLNASGTAPNGYVNGDTNGDLLSAPIGWQLTVDPTQLHEADTTLVTPTLSQNDLAGPTPGSKNMVWPPASGPTVAGNFVFQGAVASDEKVEIDFVDPFNQLAFRIQGVQPQSNGNYSFFAINLPANFSGEQYTVVIKGDTYLTRKLTLTYNGGGIVGLNANLINGDLNKDNEVGPADFSGLAAAFGSFAGDTNYTTQADFNNDGEVGPADFSILASSFGEFGD